jgi:glutamate carboxypeptidase
MRLEIAGGMNKPVFEFNGKKKALFAKADALATELGCPLTPQTVGGGSDGNFTSHVGTPTLDGLGVVGDFIHNPNEHITVNDIPFRVALLARLIQTL